MLKLERVRTIGYHEQKCAFLIFNFVQSQIEFDFQYSLGIPLETRHTTATVLKTDFNHWATSETNLTIILFANWSHHQQISPPISSCVC